MRVPFMCAVTLVLTASCLRFAVAPEPFVLIDQTRLSGSYNLVLGATQRAIQDESLQIVRQLQINNSTLRIDAAGGRRDDPAVYRVLVNDAGPDEVSVAVRLTGAAPDSALLQKGRAIISAVRLRAR